MQGIEADSRHSEIKMSPWLDLGSRLFPHWRMTCFPTGCFVSRYVEPIIEECHEKMNAESVISLVQFVRKTAPDLDYMPAY